MIRALPDCVFRCSVRARFARVPDLVNLKRDRIGAIMTQFCHLFRRVISRFPSVTLIFALTSLSAAEQVPRLTVERIASWPQLSGTPPASPTWSPDSNRLAFLWNDEGMPFREVWVVDVAVPKPKQVTRLQEGVISEAQPRSRPIAKLSEAAAARANRGISEVIWTDDGRAFIFGYQGDLFQVGADGTGLEQLVAPGGAKYSLDLSPDGQFLSFLRDGDLWLRNQRTNEMVQATRVGVLPIGAIPGGAHGRPDMEFSSYRWSPDSRHIALQYDDRRDVRKQLIPDYLPEETRIVPVRRDHLGDSDQVRGVAIYAVERGRTRFIELPDKTDRRIGSIRWSPDGKLLLVDQNSEDAVQRWLYVVQPEDGEVREIWHDGRETRTTRHWASEWHSDGQGVVLVSDTDDRHHLYSLRLGDSKPKQLTFGDWSVVGGAESASVTVAAGTRRILFVSTQKNPYERQVYAISESGGAVTPVTSLPGTHLPFVAPDGAKVALLHSSDVTPPELYVVEASGTPEQRITRSPLQQFYSYEWIQPRYVTFRSHTDGATLHGRLLEPPRLDPTRKYPVIVGPVYSNSVRNRWLDRESQKGFYSMVQQHLAMEGYIGLQVDVRGSIGHGRQFREKILRGFGGIDVEDLHSGVEYLKTLPYVDPQRIGIWGTSYGGLMTTMSLFKKPGVYAAGVACAPATNVWHARPGITGVMRRPQAYPDAYRRSSSISYAEGLQDHLLIIHGMVDDIVLFKDTVTLAEKLMLLGKEFDVVIAPSAVHDWEERDYVAAYLLRKLVNHFNRYLGGGSR